MKIVAYADTPEQARDVFAQLLTETAGRYDGNGRNKTEQKENAAIARELRYQAELLGRMEFKRVAEQAGAVIEKHLNTR
jgi:hypothetical protein